MRWRRWAASAGRSGRDFLISFSRAPKIAVPTRTWVAPNFTASSKSPLMPMLRLVSPWSRASLARKAKCGAASSSTGGMHIRPSSGSSSLRAWAISAAASRGRTPAFCGSSPVLTCRNRRGHAPAFVALRRQGVGQLRPVQGLDHVEQRHRLLDLVGLQRPDQVQFQVGKFAFQRRKFALRLLHPVLAEQALAGRQGFADAGLAARSWTPPPDWWRAPA